MLLKNGKPYHPSYQKPVIIDERLYEGYRSHDGCIWLVYS